MTELPLTDTQIKGLIQTLVTADPDYDSFSEEYAILGEHFIPVEEQAAFTRDLLSVMRESPQLAAQIETLLQASASNRFDACTVTVPVLFAVTFLLRSHIQFKRRADGKWEFQIEHKPVDSKLLTQLLNKLATLLPGETNDPADK